MSQGVSVLGRRRATDQPRDSEAPSPASEAAVRFVVLLVVGLIFYGWYLGLHLGNAHNGLLGASFTAVGLYVVRMRPRHREGWLFLAVGLLHTVMFFGRQYAHHSIVRRRRQRGADANDSSVGRVFGLTAQDG